MLMSAALIFCTILSASCSNDPVEDPAGGNDSGQTDDNVGGKEEDDDVIETGANLRFVKNSDGTYGFEIDDAEGDMLASQPKPAIIRVKNAQGAGRILQAGYKKVTVSGSTYKGQVTLGSSAGSKFTITDEYKVANDDAYTVTRTVKVTKAAADDRGFSSEFSLISAATGSAFKSFDLFAPGFLYRNNANNNPYENNPNLKGSSFCFWETQYGLPLFMAYSPSAKKTISLSHINPEISSGLDEKNCRDKWMVASSVQYGSLGA